MRGIKDWSKAVSHRPDSRGTSRSLFKRAFIYEVAQGCFYGPDATPHDLGDNPLRSQFDYELTNGQRTKLTETFYFDDDSDPQTPDVAKTTTYDWVYDANHRLLSETIDHHNDDLDRTESFTMDLFGNRLSRTVDYAATSTLTDQAFAYLYDDNDRLIAETLDNGNDSTIDQTTTYDWGQDNTVTPPLLGGTQQLGKTISAGGATVSTETFSYNLQGRLAEVVKETYTSGSVTARTRVQYAYDSSGIRIRATEADDANLNGTFETSEEGNTTEYLIDHRNHTGYAQTIVETTKDSSGQTIKRIAYTFGTDEITQTVTDYISGDAQTPVVHTFGHDAHGSVRILLDAAGALTQAYTYAAYGDLLAIYDAQGNLVGTVGAADTAAALTSLLYAGEFFDSLIGQQYLRARWYDTVTGRFSRLDPYFGNLQDPLSFNKYLYTHANPINGRDPSGLLNLGSVLSGISISSVGRGLKHAAVYAGRQAAISALQTGIEFSVMKLLFPDAKFDIARTFGTNFASNLVTGGINSFFLRNLLDVGINTLADGVYGEDVSASLALNILGAFGGEALFNAAGGIAKRAFGKVGSDPGAALERLGLKIAQSTLPGTPISIADGLRKVIALRRQFGVSRRKNVAFAEVDLGTGATLELRAVSGDSARGQGFISPPGALGGISELQRRLVTESTGDNLRRYEAELIILEHIANSFPTSATGRVRLFSELPFCTSCQGIIRQFKEMYPGIKLITSHGYPPAP